jgi:hypothetical protein
MKTVTAMFAETVDNTQHSTRLNPESRNLNIELQPRKPKDKNISIMTTSHLKTEVQPTTETSRVSNIPQKTDNVEQSVLTKL